MSAWKYGGDMAKRLETVVGDLKKRLNLKPIIGYLGDGTGEVHDRNNRGRYFVRLPQSNGSFGSPVSLPAVPNANIPMSDGIPVEIGYDPNGRLIILGVSMTALAATDTNTLNFNPLDNQASEFVQQAKLDTLYATRHADSDNKPFYAVVFPGLYYDSSDVLKLFIGDQIDLSSFQPSSGEHCYAVVLLKEDGDLEAFASTAIDSGDPLSFADIEEALALATAESVAIRAWQVDGDDTMLTVDDNKIVDLRALISPVPSAGGGGDDDTARYMGWIGWRG